MAFIIYSFYALATFFLAPVAMLFLAFKKRHDPPYGSAIWQLLGFKHKFHEHTVIFHLVSVGEVVAARPLIKKFLEEFPEFHVLITTTTTTGRDEALKIEGIDHAFMPLDSCLALRLFFNKVKPSRLYIMETELWPNLLRIAYKKDIRICVFNARMPEKTFLKYHRHGDIAYSLIFRYLDMVLAQSKEDAKRFIELGVDPKHCHVTNSLKYDLAPNEDLFFEARQYKKNLNFTIIGAISTHDSEEELILESFLTMRRENNNVKLLLVPRHQSSVILARKFLDDRKVSYCLKTALYPDFSNLDANIIIGNTFGEMEFYLGFCDLVIMGGSFVDIGGHNPLEPAFFSIPIITGPYYYNFQELFDLLIERKGAFLANDHQRLFALVLKLLSDSHELVHFGMNALEVQLQGKGAINSTLNYMKDF